MHALAPGATSPCWPELHDLGAAQLAGAFAADMVVALGKATLPKGRSGGDLPSWPSVANGVGQGGTRLGQHGRCPSPS